MQDENITIEEKIFGISIFTLSILKSNSEREPAIPSKLIQKAIVIPKIKTREKSFEIHGNARNFLRGDV